MSGEYFAFDGCDSDYLSLLWVGVASISTLTTFVRRAVFGPASLSIDWSGFCFQTRTQGSHD